MTAQGEPGPLGGPGMACTNRFWGLAPPHGVLPTPPYISALKERTLGSREMPCTATDHGGTTPGISLSV